MKIAVYDVSMIHDGLTVREWTFASKKDKDRFLSDVQKIIDHASSRGESIEYPVKVRRISFIDYIKECLGIAD